MRTIKDMLEQLSQEGFFDYVKNFFLVGAYVSVLDTRARRT